MWTTCAAMPYASQRSTKPGSRSMRDGGRVHIGAAPIPGGLPVDVALLDQVIQVGLDRRVCDPAPESSGGDERVVHLPAGGGRPVPEHGEQLQVGLRRRE